MGRVRAWAFACGPRPHVVDDALSFDPPARIVGNRVSAADHDVIDDRRDCRRASRAGRCGSGPASRSRAGLTDHVPAGEDYPAAVGAVIAGDHVEERGLAGAVRPDDARGSRPAGTVKLTSATAVRPPKRCSRTLQLRGVRLGSRPRPPRPDPRRDARQTVGSEPDDQDQRGAVDDQVDAGESGLHAGEGRAQIGLERRDQDRAE